MYSIVPLLPENASRKCEKVSSLSPALAAVLGRCAAEPLRENFIKETDVGIACPGTDLCDGQVCIFQEILGEEQTVLLEDGFEGLARVPADVARHGSLTVA